MSLDIENQMVIKKMWSVEIDETFKGYVDMLPKEIQKKLYIYSMRFFWRDYVPLTAKIPSWYDRKIKIDKKLYDAREKNIHFMHLPFNILPENKKWIMGCQCSYCKEFGKKGKLGKMYVDTEYRKLLMDPLYFHKNMTLPSYSSDWNNHVSVVGIKYFDPFFNTEYEDMIIQSVRKNIPLYFLENEMTHFDMLELLTFDIDDL
jgi:hypothetical protein